MDKKEMKIIGIGKRGVAITGKICENESVEIHEIPETSKLFEKLEAEKNYSIPGLDSENTKVIFMILDLLSDKEKDFVLEALKKVQRENILIGIYNIGNSDMEKFESESDFIIDFDSNLDEEVLENNILKGIEGILSPLTKKGVNMDFADMKVILKNSGRIFMITEKDELKNFDNHLEKINQKIKDVIKMESSNTENLEFTIIVTINSGSDLGFTQLKNIVKTVSSAHSEENIVLQNYIIEERFENTVETIIYLKKR